MDNIFKYNLCAARKAAGLTQKQLANKLNVSNNAISNWEKGVSRPDIDQLAKICEILNVSPNDLLSAKLETVVSIDEQVVLNKYRKLDTHGEQVVTAVLDLEFERCTNTDKLKLEDNEKTLINRYRQCDDNSKKIINSVVDMSSDVNAYRAAMSGDDHADELIKMSKEEVERLMSLPMTDEDL